MAMFVHSHVFLIHSTKGYSAPLTVSDTKNTKTIKADTAVKTNKQKTINKSRFHFKGS